VRWHDWYSRPGGSSYNVAQEMPMKSLTNALTERIPDAEVFTLFLKSSEDAAKFQEEKLLHDMTGNHRCGMYYLWPTQKSYASDKPAYCEERSFFSLMERVEAMGIPSRYPAPAHLYRQLCGKLLYTSLCMHKEYKIPASVRIYASEWLDDEDETIDNALYALNQVRRNLWDKGPCTSGVVKLGFSWMGQDVVKFNSRDDFREKLRVIFGTVNQIPTSCFVQDFVENRIVELRIHAFADSERGFSYEMAYILLINLEEEEHMTETVVQQDEGSTSSCTDEVKAHNGDSMHTDDCFMTTGVEVVTLEAATSQIWKGDVKAQQIAEAEARTLADRWLAWYQVEWTSRRCPANARFDFHVCWDGVNNPELWTCEVTECGAWLCGFNLERRNVAVINSMFSDKKCVEDECVCKKMLDLPPP